MHTLQERPQATPWQLFRLWGLIGLQSFGGGASTVFLIQRTFIDQQRWMTMEEFSQYWNLCLFTPGINIVAITVLIGRKLSGWRGVMTSLLGLLLPSATITCLLAAGFVLVQHSHAVQAILRGVIPATAGIMFLVAVNFARPIVQREYKAGIKALVLSAAIMLASAAALIVFKLSVIALLLSVALLGALIFTPWRSVKNTPNAPTPQPTSEIAEEGNVSHD